MNQTRAFLIFAWLMVATLLWMEWGKEQAAPASPTSATTTAGTSGDSTVPSAANMAVPGVPATTATPGIAQATATPTASARTVTINTDVLRLSLDGGSVRGAALLRYPQDTKAGSAPVQLFDERPASYFVAQSGWVNSDGAAPSHEAGFVPEAGARSYTLAPGANELSVPFVWQGAERRQHPPHLHRQARRLRDRRARRSGQRRQRAVAGLRLSATVAPSAAAEERHDQSGGLQPRVVRPGTARKTSTRSASIADFVDDGPLEKQVTGGWIALSAALFLRPHGCRSQGPGGDLLPRSVKGALRTRIREPAVRGFNVAPGHKPYRRRRSCGSARSCPNAWTHVAPGLELALDYGMFTFLSKPIHWLLEQLHKLTHNWGWAIVLLVVLIKLALYPLSAAQYKSMAKMRQFQPRIAQLKERYGDDKQKFQMAMMELYKKEKINPVGGCLPILIQMPVFLALYWVLLEAVELRQAPWILGWINDLTARDPYFILPIINMLVMWTTQKLTPAVGMDPMQQKMMQLMPIVFGVMFAFFPAGLVLYWVTNGALGLLQQWWNTKRYSEAPARA